MSALIDLRERYRGRFASNAGIMVLIDALFENPLVDAQRAARVMKKTAFTARAAIAALERDGWLTEVTGRNWGKLYIAKELMALLEKPDADLRAPWVA